MDLQSTLIRAEALFRRFQRTVEAVDKKNNFPAPSTRQRKSITPSSPTSPKSPSSTSSSRPQQNGASAEASGVDKGKRPASQQGAAAGDGTEKEKVISPELRNLLSRKVEKLEKSEIVKHGGGVGT